MFATRKDGPAWRRLLLYPVSAAFVAMALLGIKPAGASGIERFIELNLCPVVERLKSIDMVSRPGDRNRFLIVALEGQGQSYVQCMLGSERDIYCEASSGFFGPRHDDGEAVFRLPPRPLAALADLGFDTTVEDGNYPIIRYVRDSKELIDVSKLVLTAIYVGYGAWSESRLKFVAPLAADVDGYNSSCAPIG